MNGEIEKKISLEEKYNDYEKTPVPVKSRQTWFEQGMVWLGEGFGLSGLATGGMLAEGLSFKEVVLVSVIGSFIVWILAMLIAQVSAHTHLSTSFTCRRSFGVKGAKIIGVILCLSNFGWYAFQADLFGNTITSVIREVSGVSYTPVIFTILGGLGMSVTAIFGFKAITKLSEFGLPLLFLLCLFAVVKTGSIIPFDVIMNAGPVGSPITVPMGIGIAVSSFAVGIIIVGDFSRFSKSPKDCAVGSSIGFFWGYIPVLICGAFLNYAFKNWNIVEIMIVSLGMGIMGAIVLVVGQWQTNDNNLYTSVLGLMNSLDGVSKIPRMRLTMIIGVISTAIAAVGMYKYFVDFLSILGIFITPIGGILIADFYICNRKEYDESMDHVVTGIKWDALISWMAAAFVGLSMTAKPIGFGWFVSIGNYIPVPIVCILTAMGIYVLHQHFAHAAGTAAAQKKTETV